MRRGKMSDLGGLTIVMVDFSFDLLDLQTHSTGRAAAV
jgi:hypothetical protein